jgi:flagellar basal body P-ring formation protein FlgA
MMTRFSLTLAALLLTATDALATPALRGDITVNKAIVTIGDMFEDAGVLAETGIFLAPQPGTTGIVPLADVERAAAKVGLVDFENVGFTRVRVVRASTVVDAGALNALIDDDLKRRGVIAGDVTAQLRFDREIGFNAEAVSNPATLINLQYAPANGNFVARFAIAGIDRPVDVSGSIELMTMAPRLAGNTPAGTILSSDDFEIAPVSLTTASAGGYADLHQLVGKQLTRQARAGIMLKANDVSEPKVVTRNSIVTVILKSGPMTLTVRGTALTTAATGEAVDVLNTVSKKILHGVARQDGAVEILTATSVAGL